MKTHSKSSLTLRVGRISADIPTQSIWEAIGVQASWAAPALWLKAALRVTEGPGCGKVEVDETLSSVGICFLFSGPKGRNSIAQGAALGQESPRSTQSQRGETPLKSPWSYAPLGLADVRRFVTQGCALGCRVSPRWGKAAKQNSPVFDHHETPPTPTLHLPTGVLTPPRSPIVLRARRMGLLGVALLILSAAAARSQEVLDANIAETPAMAEEATPELQARWEYFVPVPISAAKTDDSPTLMDVILGRDVFAHARPDLADLRLYDTTGKTIPYALRYRRPQSLQERVPAREFNRAEPDNGPRELTLDLQQNEELNFQQDIQYNEIKIETSGRDFRRAVEVDGSEDGQTWRRLVAAQLIRFESGKQKIDLDSLTFADSRFRYVRVRVYPDPGRVTANQEQELFRMTQVSILRHTEDAGERLTQDATLQPRQPTRNNGAPASAWIIDLGGDNVPCDRIEVDVADSEFARDILIEAEYPSGPLGQLRFTYVGMTGEPLWQRKPGQPKKPMIATFGEVQTRRLRLFVTDHRNPPLSIRSIKFSAPARQLVFARPASEAGEPQLFFGNPRAELPVYDFARNLPAKLAPPPARSELNAAARNQNFVPPPLPLTERFPWLIYLVLGSVTVVLAFVIVSLSRAAITIHDANVADAQT